LLEPRVTKKRIGFYYFCTKINSNFWSNLLGLYQRTIIIARGTGEIKIGNNVGISGATIYAHEKIEIGDACLIGANVKIIDNDFHPIEWEERNRLMHTNVGPEENDLIPTKPIKIGKKCFIGCNTIILKGTVLGDGCVVGAGAVVSGKFPPNSVIAGNPARIIRTLSSSEDQSNG
jgi:acetyltransferase-like isoleucine patch superfamily enzyme